MCGADGGGSVARHQAKEGSATSLYRPLRRGLRAASPEKNLSFGQPEGLTPATETLWPIRPDQQPRVVRSVEEFLEALLFETHVDRVVVLSDGIRLLGQEYGIPEVIRRAALGSRNVRQFLDQLTPADKAMVRGRLWHYGNIGSEKEIRVKKGKGRKCFKEIAETFQKQQAEGVVPQDAPLYISEWRWLDKVPHPICSEEKVKTSTNVDIFDITPHSRRMPLWERSEGGIFIGERGAGSGMHVDQCLWSNVGRNWCGHKLFAIWSWQERHTILDDAGKGTVFHVPLTDRHRAFLSRAKTIAVVKPGDVWVFSGAQPHTALCVGDGLNISAYESFVSAHKEAVRVLVRSNTKDAHWKGCWMDDEDLDELYEDVVDRLQESRRELKTLSGPIYDRLRVRLEECVESMREHGDVYSKELWSQEDRGERKRKREESSDEEVPGGKAPRSPYSYTSRSYSDEEATTTANATAS